MNGPLMPKATAIWLLDNTALTFQQIADFCRLHLLEVEALANAETGTTAMGLDPITSGQLTWAEIEASSQDPARPLQLTARTPLPPVSKKGPRYTPLSRRQDKPSAILWLVKQHPEMSDLRIMRLVGTTKGTISALRNKTHWNILNIKPQSPVSLGMCSQEDLDAALALPTTTVAPKAKKTTTPKKKTAKKPKVQKDSKKKSATPLKKAKAAEA